MPDVQLGWQLVDCSRARTNIRRARSLPLVHSAKEGTVGMERLLRRLGGVTGGVRTAGLPPPPPPPYLLTHLFASACTSSIALSAYRAATQGFS